VFDERLHDADGWLGGDADVGEKDIVDCCSILRISRILTYFVDCFAVVEEPFECDLHFLTGWIWCSIPMLEYTSRAKSKHTPSKVEGKNNG
jgi:hypothetical protein